LVFFLLGRRLVGAVPENLLGYGRHFFCAAVLPDNCSTVTRACDYFSLHFEFVSDDSILNDGTAV
jgi:hypothetical protein